MMGAIETLVAGVETLDQQRADMRKLIADLTEQNAAVKAAKREVEAELEQHKVFLATSIQKSQRLGASVDNLGLCLVGISKVLAAHKNGTGVLLPQCVMIQLVEKIEKALEVGK